jgi:hypothetical protein
MIKNWNKFNEADETATAATDVETMRKTNAAASLIKTQAESLKGKNKIADVESAVAIVAKQYEKNTESLITSSLTYYKTLAERQKAAIKIKDIDQQITKMLPELQRDIQDMATKISQASTAS